MSDDRSDPDAATPRVTPEPRVVKDVGLPLGAPPSELRHAAAQALGWGDDELGEIRVRKVSVDARERSPKKVYTLDAWHADEAPEPEPIAQLRRGTMQPLVAGQAPVIVGTGPAGLWAALRLVEAGIPSILLDRGGALSDRHAAVRSLRREGRLDPESNLCFGAGGAGTYSDGKLYTRRRDAQIQRIHEDLAALGAPPEILVEAHPHIGTNRLIKMLVRLEQFLRDAGCDIRYGQKVDGLLRTASGAVAGVRVASPLGGSELVAPAVVLATGHSARDVYHWLHAAGVGLAPKPFAIGARCEHPQVLIDKMQFGPHAGHPALDPAEYFLTAQVGARGVYSFCMCPGGFVIPTTTELGHLNVNGMSNHRRGSDFANAALVVTVEPSDFWLERPGDLAHLGPLAGLAFQRALEAKAYAAGGGGYAAPAQRLTDFLDGRSGDVPERTSYRPGLTAADLRTVLPERVHAALARGILRFDQKMRGYLTREAVLIGVETTTSSPIRIVRDERSLMAPGFDGLFPTGEGAGMAGGIISSALDGLRVAEAVLARSAPS